MNEHKKTKIIIVSGPTASGKTKKAVQICKEQNGEIISADSRQIYKYLDIGTNKEGVLRQSEEWGVKSGDKDKDAGLPRGFAARNDCSLLSLRGKAAEAIQSSCRISTPHSSLSTLSIRIVDGIPQHLTDIITPDKTYSVADFVKDADLKMKEIEERGKVPVVTGGTGLYIKALLYGLDEMPKADENLRKELKSKTQEELYKQLLKIDPEAAEKNRQNPQRLLRALEVNILSGKSISAHYKPKKARYDFEHFSISVENKLLYERINARCRQMLENGMIEETKKVLDMGFAPDCPGLSGIGYRHVVQYLDNKISKEELIEEFSKDTRHYAKRQNTWFRAQPDTKFITAE